jgi:iron complex outermembrane recepter protein
MDVRARLLGYAELCKQAAQEAALQARKGGDMGVSMGMRCLVMVASALATLLSRGALAEDDVGVLQEVVVTATRHNDAVNRVPLAVTAQTQEALDQQGIQTIADLQATVPGLRLSGQEASGNATVAIRGISQQSGTSATTGFYLDETALQKRAAGGFGSQNGTPVPPLFDLERVEVLRGPQGTLFGGGSEGGTIRYIQPSPSLTDYSGYGRAQWLTTQSGGPSYEGGVAFGGPIVEDVLGFRASIFGRKSGGYIDLTDYRTGQIYDANSNSGELHMGRVALAWAPSRTTKLTLSYFKSEDNTDSLNDTYNLSQPGQLTVAPLCFNTPYILSQPVAARAFLVPPAVLPVNPGCNANTGAYVAPGYTVGPFDLRRYQSLALGPSPTRTGLDVGSAIFQWDVTAGLQLKSITSYVEDLNRGQSPQNFPLTLFVYPGTAQVVTPGRPPLPVPTGSGFNANVTSVPNGLGLGALLETNTHNQRDMLSQEIRLASAAEQRVSYVVGAYFANTRATVQQLAQSSDLGFQQLAGLSILQRYGVPYTGFFSNIYEFDRDLEKSVFGDVSAHLTDHWSASAGVRVTHIKSSFVQSNYGPNGGTSAASQALVSGEVSATPVTPKASIQYYFTPDDLLYATASKGFRAGGVNQVLTSASEGTLAQYGLTNSVLPRTYRPDSVWNYELGSKLRFWGGRAQINAAVYDLEWKDVQTFVFLGDGAVFNVPSARSRGAELEAQMRPVRPLTFNAAIAYTNAKYTSSLAVPAGPGSRAGNLVVAQNGQEFPQPDWTVDLGARYEVAFGDLGNGYARVDYRWFDGFLAAPLGTAAYSPDSSEVPGQKNVNLRIGFERAGFDVNLFVLNLTDAYDGRRSGGRSQCTNTDCSTFNSYTYGITVVAPTPRQIGLQVAYRFRGTQ